MHALETESDYHEYRGVGGGGGGDTMGAIREKGEVKLQFSDK